MLLTTRQSMTLIAIAVAILCLALRLLAAGWLLLILGLPYLYVLGTHIRIHRRYAAAIADRAVRIRATIVSHVALLGAFLLQWDFNDMPGSYTPIGMMLGWATPVPCSACELPLDVLLFVPTLFVWWRIARAATAPGTDRPASGGNGTTD